MGRVLSVVTVTPPPIVTAIGRATVAFVGFLVVLAMVWAVFVGVTNAARWVSARLRRARRRTR